MKDEEGHEELTATEARQAERRRTNRRALIWGTVIGFIVLALLWAFWVQPTPI